MKIFLLTIIIKLLDVLSKKVTVDFDDNDKNDIVEIKEKLENKLEELKLRKMVDKESK